jgi:hypothetical protein
MTEINIPQRPGKRGNKCPCKKVELQIDILNVGINSGPLILYGLQLPI